MPLQPMEEWVVFLIMGSVLPGYMFRYQYCLVGGLAAIVLGSIRWCVWSFRPSSPLRLPHLKCLLLLYGIALAWPSGPYPLFLDPSDGVFGRFDLAALCGCRTLNVCLFVSMADSELSRMRCVAGHGGSPLQTVCVCWYCFDYLLRVVESVCEFVEGFDQG